MIAKNFLFIIILIFSVASQSRSSSISGAILASNFASSKNDFKKSAEYTLDILNFGIKDFSYYNDALLYLIASGNFEKAFKLSKEMYDLGLRSPVLGLVLIIEKVKKEKLNEGFSLINLFEEDLPQLLIYSLRGWIYLKQGKLESALIEFNNLGMDNLKFDIGSYYSAIAYAQSRNYEAALKIISINEEKFKLLGKNFEIFKSELIHKSGNKIGALSSLKESINKFSNKLTLKEIYRKFFANNFEGYKIFRNENNGISDTLLLFSQGESRQINQNLVEIFYCQLAYYLSEKNSRFKLKLAIALEEADLFEEAREILNSISESDIFFLESRLVLADLLNKNKKERESINILENLINTYDHSFEIYELLGNIYRYNEKFELSQTSYSKAISLINNSEFDDKNLWLIYFFRGITLEQLKRYDSSMKDLRKALSLMPDQPQVLNYLGYMLIEQKENLEEALAMIRKAVEISPQSGYIIDSLAWGLYQLGRYSEAIEPMEKAIELEPEDPIVNDHLGDILWKNGRKREAYFQWKKALIFNPKKELKLKIENKINFGLQE